MRNLLITLVLLCTYGDLTASEANRYMAHFKKSANPARDSSKGPWRQSDEALRENFVNMCKADEGQYMQVERSVINPIISSLQSKSLQAIKKSFAENADLDLFQNSMPLVASDKILITPWKNIGKAESNNEFFTTLQLYLDHYKTIDDVQMVSKKIKSSMISRDKKYGMTQFNSEIFFEIRGKTAEGIRRVDRGYLDLGFSLNKNEWKVAKFKISLMDTLQKIKPDFEEITQVSGLEKLTVYQRTEAIRRGGYALAIADFNNDGYQDMYVGARGEGKIYTGTADGKFVESNPPGFEKMTYVKSAVWADFDNDGFKDLVTVRFTPGKLEEDNGRVLYKNSVTVYKNIEGKKFQKMKGVIESGLVDYAMPAAVADFNNDGLLDIYVGYPGHRDFTTFHGIDNDKTKLKTQGVYLNEGSLTFKATSMSDEKDENFEKFAEYQKLYPHSSLAADFNQDGKVDILVVDDRGNLSPFYVNAGNGKFVRANNKFQVANEGYGMSAATADFNNDGLTDLLATSVRYAALDRMTSSCSENWGTNLSNTSASAALSAHVGKNGVNGKTFAEQALSLGLSEPGEGLAGIEFLDYNNDGYQDIYVTNGLWSGTNRFQDITSEFVRTKYTPDNMVMMESKNSTQSIVMQLLSQYKGSLSKGKAKDKLTLSGFQRNKLYLNNKNGTFTEVGYLEGVDSIADGYVIAKTDINNDGKLDLVLRNADPGSTEVSFSPIQIFKNKTSSENFLKVKLIGNSSNRDAIGAEVKIETLEGTQVQQVIANSGTVQSETELHFGLAESTMVKKLNVRWPSGQTLELKDVKMGTLKIEESTFKNISSINTF
jgi:hypothetical protein